MTKILLDFLFVFMGLISSFIYFGGLLMQIINLAKQRSIFLFLFGFFARLLLAGLSLFLLLKFANLRHIFLFFAAFFLMTACMIIYQLLKRKKTHEN